MSLRPDALRGERGRATSGVSGVIDHRLARRALITQYRQGRLARHQVCDAHPELVRAARAIGRPTERDCPICEADQVVHVTYVFGPRLPAHGRCVTTAKEVAQLDRRSEELAAYVVEVCPSCTWHHLVQTFPLGGPARRRNRSI